MTAETSSPKSEQPDPAQIPNVGVAIVGGGIAGLYCAFKIKRKLDKSDEDYSREFEAKFNDGDNKEGDKNKIFLFEASPRLGGRICTRRRPDLAYTKMPPSEGNAQDQPKSASETTAPQQARNSQEGERDFTGLEFYAEFGPMRIEKDQILLHQLLEDLEIEKEKDETKARLVPIPAFGSPVSKHEPKYELIGAENDQKTPWDLMLLAFARIVTGLRVSEKPTLREEELNRGTSPGQSEEAIQKKKETIQKERECLQRQLKDVDERLERAGSPILADPSLWKRNLEDWIGSLEEPHYQNLREYATFDGEPLWNIGFWNLLSDVLSHDAVMKLRDLGTFYHLIPENPNAAEWLIFWLRNIKGSKALKGIFGGMECITEELEKRLEKEPKVEIHRNHKLIRIKPDEEPSISVDQQGTLPGQDC